MAGRVMNPTESPQNRLLSIDELDRNIVNLDARINAATYELLVLVRQFDERAGWLQWGLANCAEWLQWRCDLSVSAAREKVRVARMDTEEDLLSFALKTTASKVEERCRELRCGTVASTSESNRAHASRSLRAHRDAGRGVMIITVELSLESGELLEKALDRARDTTASRTPEFFDECWSAQQADALVTVANAYLSGNGKESTGTSDNYQVTVHVDSSALANGDGRSSLPIELVKPVLIT